eukprot:2081117-Amphidinium_carterae.1
MRAGVISSQHQRSRAVSLHGESDVPEASLLPMGFPHPNAFLRASPPLSSRRRQRYWRTRKLQLMQNTIAAQWSWLALGCPPRGLSAQCLNRPVSAAQRECIDRVGERLRHMCRQAVEISTTCGGSKITQLLAALAALRELSPYSTMQSRASGVTAPTIPLEATNMALPKMAAQVRLQEPVLPALAAEILNEQDVFALPPDQCPRPPKGFLDVTCWPKVAAALCESGLVQLRASLPHCLRAGLFGVAKKGTSQARIIVDRRPQNSQERRITDLLFERGLKAGLAPDLILHHQRLCCLPHPSQMVDIMMPEDGTLRISAEDAADYYHGLRHPDVRIWETAVGPPVYAWELTPEALQTAGGARQHPDPGVRPHQGLDLCLCAPAMGDSKSPDIAQM